MTAAIMGSFRAPLSEYQVPETLILKGGSLSSPMQRARHEIQSCALGSKAAAGRSKIWGGAGGGLLVEFACC